MGSTYDELYKKLVDTMQTLFGGIKAHPGYRTTHAKGFIVEGSFTPSEGAKNLSKAPHYNQPSTPVLARFSVGGGIPTLPDADDLCTPKGVAIRFQISEHTFTDFIAHSFNGFAVRTGELFLQLLILILKRGGAAAAYKAKVDSGQDATAEKKALDAASAALGAFAKENPGAGAFLNTDNRPNPYNYGTIIYYEPNTHQLINAEGKVTNARFRLIPADGEHLYSKAEAVAMPKNYLEDDLQTRFPDKPLVLTIMAHIADPDDNLNDATVPYKSTTFVEVGKLTFNKVTPENSVLQQKIAFHPNPERGGVEGIKASDDPLIKDRVGVYKISHEQRESAPPTPPFPAPPAKRA